MAEILGIFASVQSTLTLVEQLAKGVKFVSAVLRAPSETRDLQEQVQRFHDIIQLIGSTAGPSAETALHRALIRASTIVAELNHLFKTKLIGQGEISRRAQQKAWVKHRTKVLRLRSKLGEALQVLLGVVTAESLVVARRNTSALFETNEMLNRVEVANSENNCTKMEIRLRRRQYVPEHGNVPGGQLVRSSHAITRPLHDFDHSLDTSMANQCTDEQTSRGRLYHSCQNQNEGYSSDQMPLQPLSKGFETLPNFLPWTYAVDGRNPALLCYDARELESTPYIRRKHCSIFYFKAGREWMRLSLSITMTVESRYWDAERTTGHMHVKGHSGISSDIIMSMIISFLTASEDIKPFAHLSIFLGGGPDTGKCKFVKSLFQAKMYLHNATRSLRHWQLRWLSARYTPCVPLSNMNLHFGAFLDEKWVFGQRFGSDQQRIDTNLYHLEFLHRLHKTPRVSQILGVLVDEEEVVTAFLAELPSKGRMSNFMTEIDIFGQPVTMERRVKWCKQIIEVVANAHNNKLVIGTLGTAPDPPFGIDGNDDVMLYRLVSTSLLFAEHKPGLFPPERRQETPRDGVVAASAETDIYQLGILLWKIVSNKCSLTRSFLCKIEGCTSGRSCTEPHADPIDLPVVDKETPQYLRNIIAACRAEDPHNRPSAYSLLNMFPAGFDTAHHDIPYPHHIQRAEDLLERFGVIFTCDECGDVISEVVFHCDTCASGDYDVCGNCFSENIHCLDQEHYLQEVCIGKHEKTKQQNFYSSVKEDGERRLLLMS